ncbi:MAG: GNAT family N-acetyltransferase [Acidobacteriia bacterium]|nr:GNAT family N-acetyltransferase [Terriglobia bacterium]
MRTEFRKAILPDEIRSLMAFDRKIFPRSDLFDVTAWKTCESYWMVVDGVKVGCCAFEKHVDFREDISEEGVNRSRKGSLYISSTGILPKFQGQGFGALLKSWEISYARYYGFTRMVTNTRKQNLPIIRLNRRFGFRVVRTTPRYYSGPTDSTVVMELLLQDRRRSARAV